MHKKKEWMKSGEEKTLFFLAIGRFHFYDWELAVQLYYSVTFSNSLARLENRSGMLNVVSQLHFEE